MKLFIYIIILLSSVCHAQTRSIVPQTPGQGSIGRTNKAWGAGYFNDIILNGTNLETRISQNNVFSFNGSTGDVEIVAGDGVSITSTNGVVTVSLVSESFDGGVGTNRIYFSNGPSNIDYSQVWQSPKDGNIAVWIWGGSGGGGAGFSYGLVSVTNGEWLTLAVGQAGFASPVADGVTVSVGEGGWPNGGEGHVISSGNVVMGGGGRSQLLRGYFTDLTNIAQTIFISGASGGASAIGTTSGSGAGGGESGGTGVGCTGGTQTSGGSGSGPGGFLQGGDCTVSGARGAGGGGDGYYGGGASSGSPSGSGGTGAGGSGFVSISEVVFGITVRGSSLDPMGLELPEYIVGHGGRQAGGLIVIGY